MVELLVLLAVLCLIFALPITALVQAGRANSRSRRNELELQRFSNRLERLNGRVDQLAHPGEVPVPPPVSVTEPVVVSPPPPPVRATPDASRSGATAADSTPQPIAILPPPSTRKDGARPQPPVPPVQPDGEHRDLEAATLEERIGLTWITRLGAAAVVLGAAYFFKVAVEQGWLGPWGRVLLGLLAGVVLLVAAERVRRRADRRYVQALLGVGLAVLYVASYAAYGFYHLVPLPIAFGGLAVVAFFGGALAYRHRAEVILVIALIAALANPVLLSTGSDQPLGLFSYVLLMTSAGLAVSFLLGFRIVPWLSLAGTVALFLGWHARFFDPTAPGVDAVTGAVIPNTAGPYWPLQARVVPLGAVVAFTAQWLGFGLLLRRRGVSRLIVVGALLSGLVIFHGGAASILLDRPAFVAIAMAVGGVIAMLVLHGAEDRPWLAVPLAASFLILALCGRLNSPDVAPVVLAGALWAGIYLASLAVAVRTPTDEKAGRSLTTILAAVVSGSVALLALWLIPGHAVALASATAVVALTAGGLALHSRSGWLPLPVAVVTLLVLIIAAVPRQPPRGTFLAFAALSGGLYFAAAAYFMLAKLDVSNPVTILAAGAPIGLVAVAISSTAVSSYGLRAVFSACAGVAAFVLGGFVLRRLTGGRNAGTILLTTGLALGTLAVGLALSGATITVAWSLMALVVVVAALHKHDLRMLAVGVVLFGVAFLRLLTVDLLVPAHAASQFVATLGEEGALRPTPLLNSRAIGLAGMAVTLLLAARATVRQRLEAKEVRGLSAGLAGLGYLLLLGFAVTEATGIATHLPTIPRGLAPEAFRVALEETNQALAEQASKRAAVATLTLGLAGGGLLVAGFAARSLFHRWAGLGVLAVTIAKLALWDIWSLPTSFRVVVLLGIGGLLLAVGYLYARFGRRLLGILKTAGVVALVLVPTTADGAVKAGHFRTEALITGVQPGLARFDVTPAVYGASEHPLSLADLRLIQNGQELAWVLRDVPPDGPVEARSVSMFDPVTLPGGGSRADFDMGAEPHSELVLSIEASGNFMRKVDIAVAEDRREWGQLATGTVYRVTVGDATASRTAIVYPASRSRWLRVTIEGAGAGKAVTINGATVRPAALARLPLGLVDLGRVTRVSAPQPGRTAFTTVLGEGGVPLQAILAAVATPRFERHVVIEGANADGIFVWAGRGVLLRAGDVESLRVPIRGTWARWRLLVDDGDDPPLEIASLRGEYRRQEVIFDGLEAGMVRLLIGSKATAIPQYDLASTLAHQVDAIRATVVVGALRPNSEFDAAGSAQAPQPWSERYRFPIAGLVALVFIGLAIAAVRLLRRAGPGS